MELKDLGLQKLKLNINDDIIETVFAKEGDHKSRGLDVQVLKNNVVTDTTGVEVEFYAKPRDGKTYMVRAIEIDIKRGKYEIIYPSVILQPGKVESEIVLTKGEQVISTKKFDLLVEDTIATDDIVEKSDERPLLAILVEAAKNEKSRIEAENKRVVAESKRVEIENQREKNESQRKSAESQRQKNEEERKSNEVQRQSNESTRQSQENKRNEAENKRSNNEESRKSSEATRLSNEGSRKAWENTRKSNEDTRIDAENKRVVAESKRVSAEEQRAKNEDARENAEYKRKSNEDYRQRNEKIRDELEINRMTAEDERIAAEKARKSSEESRKAVENTRQSNESKRVAAENERAKNEDARKTNENTRIANEKKREQNRKIVESWIANPSQFNGKDLEFIWNGTKLGVRLKGDTEYQYVDLKGQKGDPGDVGNLTAEQVISALNYQPAKEEEFTTVKTDVHRLGDDMYEVEDLVFKQNYVLDEHIRNKANPHNITAEQIGAATKSDLDKAGKVQSVNNKTGAVVLGKNDVGLGNLDNVRQATKQEFNNHVNGKFHIVESGSNSNGKFVKFADGTMICYIPVITLGYLNSHSLAKAWNLPATFTGTDYACFASKHEAYYNDKSHAGLTARPSYKTTVSLDLVSYGSSNFTSSNSMKVSCLAIGRWK